MNNYRAFLMGGVCLGLLSVPLVTKTNSLARDGQAVQARTSAQDRTIVVAEGEAETTATATASEDAAPPATPSGTTDYYGETAIAADQPFAAEAKMNPDYTVAAGEASGAGCGSGTGRSARRSGTGCGRSRARVADDAAGHDGLLR